MRHCEAIVSVGVIFHYFGRVGPGVSECPERTDEIGIHEPNLFFLEDGVEQFEDLLA